MLDDDQPNGSPNIPRQPAPFLVTALIGSGAREALAAMVAMEQMLESAFAVRHR